MTVKSYPNVPNTDWLEVYYDAKDLDDGAVTSVTDLSPNTNNGTVSGDPQISDGAFVLDGTGDYISTSVNATLTYHTASMWIMFDNPSTWEAVYFVGPSSVSGADNFAIYVHAENYFRLESAGGAATYFDVNYQFVPGKWVHMTVVFKGTSLADCEVYIDNVKLSPRGVSSNPATAHTITGTNNLNIGARPGYDLEGKIANFRLFNRALTQDEIYQLYAYQKEYFGHGGLGMTLKAGRLNAPSGGIVYPRGRTALDYYEETTVENWVTVVSGTTANISSTSRGRILYQRIGNFCSVHFSKVAMYVVGASAYLVSKVPERFQPLSDPGAGDILHFPTRAVSNSGFEVMYYYNDANNQWGNLECLAKWWCVQRWVVELYSRSVETP